MKNYLVILLSCLLTVSCYEDESSSKIEDTAPVHVQGEGYTKDIVVTLPWGTEPGEVGRIPDVASQIPGGPSCIDIDSKNTIYLLDAGNKRVLIINETGQLTNYFPLDNGHYYGSSLIKYVENEDALYIHDYIKKTFSVYTKAGALSKRFRYNETIGPLFAVEGARIIGVMGYIPLQDLPGGETAVVQTVLHDSAIQGRFYSGGKYSNTVYYHEERKDSTDVDRYTLKRPDDTTQVFEMNAVLPEYYTSFAYETPEYESIFMAYPKNRTKKPIVVLKFNKNMALVSKIEDPEFLSNRGYYVERPLVFDEKGDIYTVTLNDKGAAITKWMLE
jgi:hypothetical protein